MNRGSTDEFQVACTHHHPLSIEAGRIQLRGRSPDLQVNAIQAAFPFHVRNSGNSAGSSLLTVAGPRGIFTRFPFHSSLMTNTFGETLPMFNTPRRQVSIQFFDPVLCGQYIKTGFIWSLWPRKVFVQPIRPLS
jgi:hypothetical protein